MKISPNKIGEVVNTLLQDGESSHAQGNLWQAEKRYRKVLDIWPGHPRAVALMGLLENSRKNDMRSIDLPDKAASKEQNEALTLANKGAILYALGRPLDSLEACRQSIEAWPSHALSYRNMATPLTEMLQHDDAISALEKAIEIEPDNLQFLSEHLFVSDLAYATTPERALELRRRYNEVTLRNIGDNPLGSEVIYRNDRNLHRKIRIGYVSSDFYQHSAVFTFAAMLKNFDKNKFEVYSYGSIEKEDSVTQEIKKSVTVYRDIKNWNDDRIALKIQDDAIDILVDLSGFTRGTHLKTFYRRPAPIQVSGWGYATGMSLDCFDWFFADHVTVPEGDEGFFRERVWRLPCTLSWTPPGYLIDTPSTRPMTDRPFTFGSYSRHHKVTQETISAWCEILRRSPDSRLIIKNSECDNKQIYNFMKQRFIDEGVYYAKEATRKNDKRPTRVAIFGASSHTDHMSGHWPLDVMLDPFPHGNGVSSFETLWMGTPILTLYGARVSGRITSSILKQLGMDDWIATSIDDYIEKAVSISNNPTWVKEQRDGIRERLAKTPMLDHKKYTEAVEEAYIFMMNEWSDRNS